MRPTSGETVYQLEEGDFAWSVDQACGGARFKSALDLFNSVYPKFSAQMNLAADNKKSPQRLQSLVAEATSYCQQRDLSLLIAELSEFVTVHLNTRAKIALRDIANAKGVSMSALVREWIDDRLDLPALIED